MTRFVSLDSKRSYNVCELDYKRVFTPIEIPVEYTDHIKVLVEYHKTLHDVPDPYVWYHNKNTELIKWNKAICRPWAESDRSKLYYCMLVSIFGNVKERIKAFDAIDNTHDMMESVYIASKNPYDFYQIMSNYT